MGSLGQDPGLMAAVLRAVVGLGVAVLAMAVALLIHHAFGTRRERRRRRHMRAAARFLAGPALIPERLPEAVSEALKRYGRPEVTAVLRRLRQSLAGASDRAISDSLEQIGEVSRLVRRTRSRLFWRRAAALQLLGACGGQRAHAALLEALDDPSFEVRQAARDGLAQIRNRWSARAAIASLLCEPALPAPGRRAFFTRLAAGTPAVLRQLLEAEGPARPHQIPTAPLSVSERKMALEALAEVGDRLSLPAAVAALRSRSPEIRATAVRALGKLGGPGDPGPALAALSDPAWFVRSTAAKALAGARCDGEACRAIGAALADGTWWVRANAARALALQGGPGLEVLAELLAGADPDTRRAALGMLTLVDAAPDQLYRLGELLAGVRPRPGPQPAAEPAEAGTGAGVS